MAPTMFFETVHALAKRADDDIGGIPKWLLVFLIMLGAGACVVVIYGIARFAFPEKQEMKPIPAEQHDYMREVRARTLNSLMHEVGGRRAYRPRHSEQSYAEASSVHG